MFIYVYVCLYVCFMSVGACEARRGYPSAVAIVIHLTWCWEPNLDALQEQQALQELNHLCLHQALTILWSIDGACF